MQWFKDIPINRKLTTVILLAVTMSMLAAGAAMIVTEAVTSRQEMLEDLRVTADLLGRNSAAPLSFQREEDVDEVHQALAALAADPNIRLARVYDREGNPFGDYFRDEDDAPPAPDVPPEDGYRFANGALDVVHAVHAGDKRVGTIHVQADLAALRQQVLLHAAIIVSILLLAGIVTVALSPQLRRPISEPILALAAVARRIAHSKDYSARATKRGDDEVGLLTDAFNQMIAEVGDAQASLQKANASMQAEIEERRAVETRLRQAHEDLKRAIASAEAANHAKDEFLAVLSHELRTPLTPVLMAISLLQEHPRLPEDVRQEILTIRRHVELEARLIDDLLDLTRIARGKLKLTRATTDAHVLIGDAIRICCADRMGDVSLMLDARRHHVFADSGRLLQVFWNVLNNATKFTQPGQRIRVVTTNPDPATLRVSITDSGIGIAPEVLPRIFRSFEQGDSAFTRRFGGLGLGLAIAQALVEAHEGRISATSEGAGHGSTFTIDLRTVDPPAILAPPAPEPPDDQAIAPGKLRLLVVEDHIESLQLLTRLLTSGGFEVKPASNIKDALAIASEHTIDLVVSDIGLPDGTGLDLMRQLRQRHGLRGICITGFGTDDDVARSTEAGFCMHLTKPLDFSKLQAAIRKAVTEPHSEP